MMDAKSIGKAIWKHRNWRGLTREAFGDLVKLTPSTIRQYETGYKSPSLAALVRMANVLEVGLDELLYGQLKVTRPVVLKGVAKKLEPLTPEELCAMEKVIDALLQYRNVLL